MKKLFISVLLGLFALAASAQTLVSQMDDRGKFGFVNEGGVFVIAPTYDDVLFEFNEGIACVQIGSNYVMINTSGTTVSKKYSWVGGFDDNGLCMVATGTTNDEDGNPTGGKYGFVNTKGEEVLPVTYAKIEDFTSKGIAKINLGGKINAKTGEFEGGKYGFVNSKAEIMVTPKYSFVGDFDENNLAWVNVGGKRDDYGKCTGGKFGAITDKGEEIIPAKYVSITAFSEGVAAIQKGKKFALVNTRGTELTKFVYDSIGLADKSFCLVMNNLKGIKSYGLLNTSGKEVLAPSYSAIRVFDRDFIAVQGQHTYKKTAVIKRGKIGFFNGKGEALTSMTYDGCSDPASGIVACVKSNLWGCVNFRGEETIPLMYSGVSTLSSDAVLVWTGTAQAGNIAYTLVDGHNNPISETYGWARISSTDQIISVGTKGIGCGAINWEGKVIIPLEYDSMAYFVDGKCAAKKGGWGYIDATGSVVVPFLYDDISISFVEGVGVVCKEGKWGGVLADGQEVIPFSLNNIEEAAEYVKTMYVTSSKRIHTERDVKIFLVRKEARKKSFAITGIVDEEYWDY